MLCSISNMHARHTREIASYPMAEKNYAEYLNHQTGSAYESYYEQLQHGGGLTAGSYSAALLSNPTVGAA